MSSRFRGIVSRVGVPTILVSGDIWICDKAKSWARLTRKLQVVDSLAHTLRLESTLELGATCKDWVLRFLVSVSVTNDFLKLAPMDDWAEKSQYLHMRPNLWRRFTLFVRRSYILCRFVYLYNGAYVRTWARTICLGRCRQWLSDIWTRHSHFCIV